MDELEQINTDGISPEIPSSASLGPNPAHQLYFDRAERQRRGEKDPNAEYIETTIADSIQVEDGADTDTIIIGKDKDGKLSVIENQ